MRPVNRIGQRFGILSVVAKAEKRPRSWWICRCECGSEVVVSNSNLVTGNSTSCGCARSDAVNMIGSRFGSLTVIEKINSRVHGLATFAAYRCLCDCGDEIKTIGMSLRNGDTKSCGCAYASAGQLRLKSHEHKRAVFRKCLQRRRAAKLNAHLPFDLELFDLLILEAHHLAGLREESTGLPHDVDHIVPLVSGLVCGLHSEANIRVIPASINRSKGNRFWPGMP